MQSVQARDKQTLFDIAVQELGDINRVFELAQLNGLSITGILASGQVIVLPDINFERQDVIAFFTEQPWLPTSGDNNSDGILGGIGYMQIGTSFIVS